MSPITQLPHPSKENELSIERRNRATDLLYNVGKIGVSIARLDWKKQFGKPLLIGLCRLEIGAVTIWANVLNCDQGPLITYASFVVIHIYNMIV